VKALFNKKFRILFVCLGFTVYAQAQQRDLTVNGVVKDESDEPLPGASVVVKGNTSKGTSTDFDGRFSLSNVDPEAVLIISYIGYLPAEVAVDHKTTLQVTLKEDSQTLEEVVVIGFQSQKKENLTAAVSSVTAQALENRPVANIGQALQGVVPGLNISIAGGDPSKVPSLNIRGATTFRQRGTSNDDKNKFDIASGSPLILLDGVEITAEDLNQLNPNDIDNMSFLKDASAAAIYGTRATFGVILVQTKSGSFNQKTKIGYSYDLSYDQPAALPDILDSYHIYKALKDKDLWTGAIAAYSEKDVRIMEQMQAYIRDPVNNKPYYMDGDAIQWTGNTNPYKELVKNRTPTQKHNFSINGGGDRVSYYLSLGLQNQKGMYEIRTDELRRYNLMTSISAKVTSWFDLTAKASYNLLNYDTPTQREDGNLWLAAKAYFPEINIYQPVLTGPNDPLPNFPTEHPVSYLYTGGKNETSRRKTILSVSPEFTILPGQLKIKGDFSLTPTTYKREQTKPLQERVNGSWSTLENRWATQNRGYVSRSGTDNYVINVYADYNRSFSGKHNFSALLGLNQEKVSYAASSLSLIDLLDPHILNPELVENVTANTSTNSHYVVTSRALFGRVMYNYLSRYLIEVDARYDGSSRFPKKDRFQFFPTLSLGWRLSEEKFMEPLRGWLDNMKIRASWGRLGDQPASEYPYQSKFGTEQGYFLFEGQRYPTGITPPSLTNPHLKWQKSTTRNLGLDLNLFKNRLSITGDMFERRVTDILIKGQSQYPALIGDDNLPLENKGVLNTTGFELAIKWTDRLSNGLRYSVGAALSDSRAKVLSYPSNPERLIGDGWLYEGYKLGDIWGYVTGGILQASDFDGTGPNGKPVYNGTTFKSEQVYPGYLWYKDLNNDGIISDGLRTVSDPGDRKVIGNNAPRFRYNMTGNIQYRGFDLDLMFQGVAKRDYWLSSTASYWGGGAGSRETFNKSWKKGHNEAGAKFPMYHSTVGGRPQTGFLLNAAYFKLKQVILGYTLPKVWTHRIYLDKVRFNVSAYNLFTVSDTPAYYDSEYISDAYPPKRTFAFGVQVGF
jgi:TonB-linked SusC/RagA family outer membrane protein